MWRIRFRNKTTATRPDSDLRAQRQSQRHGREEAQAPLAFGCRWRISFVAPKRSYPDTGSCSTFLPTTTCFQTFSLSLLPCSRSDMNFFRVSRCLPPPGLLRPLSTSPVICSGHNKVRAHALLINTSTRVFISGQKSSTTKVRTISKRVSFIVRPLGCVEKDYCLFDTAESNKDWNRTFYWPLDVSSSCSTELCTA